MFEVIAVAVLVLTGSMLCGSALCAMAGLPARCPAAPAVGFAALLVLADLAIRLPSRSVAAPVTLTLACGASLAYLRARHTVAVPPLWAILAAGAAVLLATAPFAVSGRIGILGVGTNDDMGEHLLAAWTLQNSLPTASSKLLASGYPAGPHSLVAALSAATGISLERVFTGLMLAVPALLALAAASLLRAGRPALRAAVAVAVGLCYLQAAYLVQASFKEPIEALMLVAFTAGLAELGRRRSTSRLRAVPLAVLAAGSVYAYSYVGLAWLIGTLLLWGVAGVVPARGGVGRARSRIRATAPVSLSAGATFLALAAPELSRMLRFHSSGYNHEAVNVFGDLLHAMPPLEALGVWPRLDFRYGLPLGSIGGVLALVALAALCGSLVACLRRREFALPAALIAAAAIYAVSSGGSPYTAAKCLTIAAPLLTLMLGRELLHRTRAPAQHRWAGRLGAGLLATILVAGAYSDLEVLRDGPVGPSAHARELAALRLLIGHRPTLFLGSDDFVHWELRGADVATLPAPLYTRTVVALRRAKARQRLRVVATGPVETTNRFAGLGVAFDFDSVPSRVLDRFTYAILPRSAYSSRPPANWQLSRVTRSYGLWIRTGPTRSHQTLTEVGGPGAILDCRRPGARALAARAGMAIVRPPPVLGLRSHWRGAVGQAGRAVHQAVVLGAGTWDVSLQYDSSVAISIRAGGLRAALPAVLEPLGPFWYVGRLRVATAGLVGIVVRSDPLPLLGRLLGAYGLTRPPTQTGPRPLGDLALTRVPTGERAIPLRQACGRYVDWYRTFQADTAARPAGAR